MFAHREKFLLLIQLDQLLFTMVCRLATCQGLCNLCQGSTSMPLLLQEPQPFISHGSKSSPNTPKNLVWDLQEDPLFMDILRPSHDQLLWQRVLWHQLAWSGSCEYQLALTLWSLSCTLGLCSDRRSALDVLAMTPFFIFLVNPSSSPENQLVITGS